MDSRRTNQIFDDAQAVRELVHWMVITALHRSGLYAARMEIIDDLAGNPYVGQLQQAGCDKDHLPNILACAKEMPTFYPPIDAHGLKDLGKDLVKILGRMKYYTPCLALPRIEDGPDGKKILTLQPIREDRHSLPELEHELQRRADLYSELARLCRQYKIPTRETFRKFAYLWPVHYVHSKTSKPLYTAISALLDFVGIGKNPKQLKVAYRSARASYPWVLEWMDLATEFLHNNVTFWADEEK
jgi:hypothetical protein